MRRITLSLALFMLIMSLVSPSVASAHVRRNGIAGKYDFEVGWLNEPTYVNQPNGVSLAVFKTGSEEGIPGVERSLKVTVTFGAQEQPFPLEAIIGKPGRYRAVLIPTRTGSYLFTFTGTINGDTIKETFESGPGRFDDVVNIDLFPASDPVKALRDEVATARTFAIGGVAVGLWGLLMGVLAIMRSRK